METEGVLVDTLDAVHVPLERKWCACVCGCIQGTQGQAQAIVE